MADAFARFLDRTLAPGALQPADRRRRPVDVRKLDGYQPALLTALDDAENEDLRWLEEAPRDRDHSISAIKACVQSGMRQAVGSDEQDDPVMLARAQWANQVWLRLSVGDRFAWAQAMAKLPKRDDGASHV